MSAPLFTRNRSPGFFTFLSVSALLLAGCPSPSGSDGGGSDAVSEGSTPEGGGLDGTAEGGLRDGSNDGDASAQETGGDGSTDAGPRITMCPGAGMSPPPTGTCTVTAGSNALLITADILTPGEVLRGGQVAVDAMGRIQCAACDCSTNAAAMGATRLVCPQGVLSPGLLNAHDHLTFAQGRPYTLTGERYEQRHDWRRGQRGHMALSSAGSASNDQMAWGELRFVMGGATSVNGSGGVAGFLRNVDRTSLEEGLNQPAVDYDTFPLGDTSGTQLTTGCGYPMLNTTSAIAMDDSYTPHVSEGIDAVARNEFLCLSMGASNLVQPQSAFIHGVALLPPDISTMAAHGTALIWSPRSNITLYGDTARVTEYARLGVSIALGSDWIISGSMNMLRELACADNLNRNYLDGFFSDEALWLMATRDAAAALAVDDVTGVIAPSHVADLALFNGATRRDHRAVLGAAAQDVVLVLRGGVPLYGDAALVAALPNGGTSCDTLDVCGTGKRVCVSRELGGRTLAQLQAANASAYPLFFCGDPMGEPSCLPARNNTGTPSPVVNMSTRYTGVSMADDRDGDGIPDAMDNCPRVFNPVRPLDNGRQADTDMDMVGDACDPCPLNAGTSTCTAPDPNDRDGDGVPNGTDNCPDMPNPMQQDRDMDMVGDACDPCPDTANPGGAACPVTIYAIKRGTVMPGARVTVLDSIVTAVISNGFYMQADPAGAGYMGADFSGVFVFTGAMPTVRVGDHVRVTNGTVSNFHGQLQLTGSMVTALSSMGAAVPPTVALPADIATGGMRAAALESVLVRVDNVTVTDTMPMPDPSDTPPTNEFAVTGNLRVDDAAFLASPFPVLGESFGSITGVVTFTRNNSKLLPRSAADLVSAGATLAAFGPGPYFTSVGQRSTPTIPTPLTVRLARPPATDTRVAITSSDPTSLAVVSGGVTVLAGMTTASVLLDGLAQAASVTLTATLGTVMQTATVRVLGATETPSLASLAPPMATLAPGGMQTFTVTLDLPAPAGGSSVALSATAGTVPATVTIPANQLSATFMYTAGTSAGSATVTATLGSSMRSSMVTVSATGPGGLILNEVDYDQPGTDSNEYIELLNTSSAPINLADYALVLINGGVMPATTYLTLPLAPGGMLMPGAYLVVAASTVTVPAGIARISFAGASNNVQNGMPDGIALINSTTHTLVDALSYTGAITSTMIAGFTGPSNLVEGTVLPTTVADSNTMDGTLCRLPNGTDTNNAASDWSFCSMVTPGAPNAR